MPRLFHRPPKYRFHKGFKQAIVSIHGKRIYLGAYGTAKSHRRYRELLDQWHQLRHEQLAESTHKTPDEILEAAINTTTLRAKREQGLTLTLNELILVFGRHTQQYYRKNGRITREAELIDEVLRFVRKNVEVTDPEKFGPVVLDELRDKMIDDLDWSRKFINNQIKRVIRMFSWAVEKELVSPTVPLALQAMTGLKKGRSRARETVGVTYVADDVVNATLPHLPEVLADMVQLQRLTGARPGEICSMRPGDVDQTGEVWLYVPAEHKTEHHEKNRVIVIGPQAQAILLRHLVRAPKAYCFSPAESELKRREKAAAKRKTPAAQGNRRGTNRVANPKRVPKEMYTTDSYRRAIQRVCQRKSIQKWSPNELRHSAATKTRKTFGLEAAQVVCGHQSANVTQVYAERDLELAKKVAQEVG